LAPVDSSSGKFGLDRELSGSLGVYKGKNDHTVVVDFDAWGADGLSVGHVA
jgi:hypothetical protein